MLAPTTVWSMQFRNAGATGLRVSRLGLGTATWGRGVDEHEAADIALAFVGGGGTLIDTAASYSNGYAESVLGGLLAKDLARDEVTVLSKTGVTFGPQGRRVDVSRGGLMRGLEDTLRRLQTDYVDIWAPHVFSNEVPLAETMSALEWAVSSGKARYVAVSNYAGWQLARAYSLLENARIPLVANEIGYSLVNRSAEIEGLPAAESLGVGVLAYTPLGGGVLTGKYRTGIPADSRARNRDFPGYAERHLTDHPVRVAEAVATAARGLGVTPAAVAIAWTRDQPGVTGTVVGARTAAQIEAAVASEDVVLPTEIVAALSDVSLD